MDYIQTNSQKIDRYTEKQIDINCEHKYDWQRNPKLYISWTNITSIKLIRSKRTLLIVPRNVLPDRVFGNLGTVTTVRNAATAPMFSRTSFTTSEHTCESVRFVPDFNTIKPTGSSPFNSSETLNQIR